MSGRIGSEGWIAAGGGPGLEVELLAERAASLGRAGERVEATLAALAAFDAGRAVAAVLGGGRERLVHEAAEAVWSYFVQREAIGLRDHDEAVAHYGIPREVMARVGGD
jgi:hypothetical protein